MPSFEDELTALLNSHSLENASGTPDFILAKFMAGCLELFNTAVRLRANWYECSEGNKPSTSEPCPLI